MNIMAISKFPFKGKPNNYAVVNENLSRSAQPNKEDFVWLKEQGVTDIINLRTMVIGAIDFNEKKEVENAGMNYHNIPSLTKEPNSSNVNKFLKLVDEISARGGKAHIHCKAGADRTGMYAFIYKAIKGIGTLAENEREWVELGHDTKIYPDLRNWAKNFIKTLK